MKTTTFFFSISLYLFTCFSFSQAVQFDWAQKTSLEAYENDFTIDKNSNIYSVGSFSGTVDFDPGPGVFNLTATGSSDIFILKLNSLGNFIWAKQMSGTLYGSGQSITIDANENVYLTGIFDGTTDFDPGPSLYNLTSVNNDMFIAKLNVNGNFVWAKKIGGVNEDAGLSITTDNSNHIYFSGHYWGTVDFDPSAAVYNLTNIGGLGGDFIAKMDINGNFKWAKSCPSGKIEVDKNGDVYMLGSFSDTADFDPGTRVYNLIALPDLNDVFISKLDSLGQFLWAKHFSSLPGSLKCDASVFGYDLTIDNAGDLIIAGAFDSAISFNPGIWTHLFTGNKCRSSNGYICKLTSSGSFIWEKHLAGGVFTGVTSDSLNNIYLTGFFDTIADFDYNSSSYFMTPNNSGDAFIQKLNLNGDLNWVKQLAGNKWAFGRMIEVDDNAFIYTNGFFKDSLQCNPGAGTYYLIDTTSLYERGFIHRLSQSGLSSLKEENNSIEISLFPNPTNGEFIIQLENTIKEVTIEIFSINGQTIFSKSYTNTDLIKLEINNESGIYLVRISAEEFNQTMRVIKN